MRLFYQSTVSTSCVPSALFHQRQPSRPQPRAVALTRQHYIHSQILQIHGYNLILYALQHSLVYNCVDGYIFNKKKFAGTLTR
jgi:DNA-binding helix-hairpin-helix protein with protein kinase domain